MARFRGRPALPHMACALLLPHLPGWHALPCSVQTQNGLSYGTHIRCRHSNFPAAPSCSWQHPPNALTLQLGRASRSALPSTHTAAEAQDAVTCRCCWPHSAHSSCKQYGYCCSSHLDDVPPQQAQPPPDGQPTPQCRTWPLTSHVTAAPMWLQNCSSPNLCMQEQGNRIGCQS